MGEQDKEGLGSNLALWLVERSPLRRVRNSFGAFPNSFSGKSDLALRNLAWSRLAEVAVKYHQSDFAQAALTTIHAEKRSRRDPRAWIADAVRLTGAVLEAHPPSAQNWRIRRDALLLLDFPLHARRSAAWRDALGDFYQRNMTRALKHIAQAQVNSGLRIWKMYNMGFVVRTRRHCIGFDVVPGYRNMRPLSTAQMRHLARMLDVAFVSHMHFDHLSREFLEIMLEEGKTVVMPETLRPRLRDKNIVRLYNHYRRPVEVGGVEVRCYPGWQRVLSRNCVYTVRADGICLAHTGDNTRPSLYSVLAEHDDVDVLLANCWAYMGRTVNSTSPRLIVTGHENELTHPSGMRASFGDTFARIGRLGLVPDPRKAHKPLCAVLNWGESIGWAPARSAQAEPTRHAAG